MNLQLELEDVGKRDFTDPDQYLFRDVNAIIEEPSIIHIIGLSGQGKSTLLRILGRLTPFDEGRISLQGRSIHEWPTETWRAAVSYVAQQAVMLPGSIEENLKVVSQIHQKPFDRDHARQLMRHAGLEELDWDKEASQLSGGQKQRLALVRTLLLRPQVLLLDEITASLDIHSQHAVEELLVHLHREEGTTMLWVTHHLEQARRCGQRIWFMAESTILEDTPGETFFQSPRTELARQFLLIGKESQMEGSEAHV
ncbi:ABC transporter ATP-binding protein [Brevibacillus migulae]|uniref:ABC transporter ATP-binding protein n=1 Tax=Brevibacillus migulae TaxID=1644114 RepID=UPI00106DF200|nr:ATP-binding cassette domain-containing protein [Brevibacillus migulae]